MDGGQQHQVKALSRAAIFRQLGTVTLESLASGTTELAFRRGSVVFGRGTPATGIHVVLSGQLKLSVGTSQGAEHVVELVGEGDSFGEAASLTNRLQLVTAIAVTDCRLLHVGRNTLLRELERDHELAQRIVGTLSDRLYRQTSELENVLFLKATGRVARFILERLHAAGVAPTHRIVLLARKGLIASQLNMTQEHFSRTLRELSVAGLIRVDGVEVEILDVYKLSDAAGRMFATGYSQKAK